MRVLISASVRGFLTPDGSLWFKGSSLGYSFWTRYLDVYDEVMLSVRAIPVQFPPDGTEVATGPQIGTIPLRDHSGVLRYLSLRHEVRSTLATALSQEFALHMRLPCHVGTELLNLREDGQPYGVEVVGDPYDVFARGVVRHPLRPFLRHWFSHGLRQQCWDASAAAYVTEHALQKRYPTKPSAFSTHFSSVELPLSAFVEEPRTSSDLGRSGVAPYRVIFVGSLAQLYKAPDVLIQAVHLCSSYGLDVYLTIVGDGQHRRELEVLAEDLGIAERIAFAGQLPAGEAVRARLNEADLFVLPSRTEGLPRAMIEAMARGLPCIGSTVGGFLELLAPEDTVPPGNSGALAAKIRDVLSNPERMANMSARNLAKAKEYLEPVLRGRRIEFYQYVGECTQEYWKRRR